MDNEWNRKTEPAVLATASDIGSVDDTWKDQGSPIDMMGYKQLGIFIELTVNDSTGNQIQVLPLHGTSGTEHVLEVADLYQKTLGDSDINMYLEFGTDNTIRQLQVQSKATDIGITAAYLTGGTSAQGTFGTWAAVSDGSFRITIDGTAYNIDAADEQVNYTGAVWLPAAQTLAIDLQGTGATAVDFTIVVEYIASADGGYLA